jgi:NADPH:quinone reductase-like Zn-dependent oxidoreductase
MVPTMYASSTPSIPTPIDPQEQNNPEDGAFTEFTMARDGYLAPIPPGTTFESAATLGVGITTIGQTLYMMMKLPLPDKPAEKLFPILIYRGSTATGTIAIQFAKLYEFLIPSG